MRLNYPNTLFIGISCVGILVSIVSGINLVFHFVGTTATVGETTEDFSIEFAVDSDTILKDGDCVTFDWSAVQIATIDFDGQSHAALDSAERCPDFEDLPKTYELVIEHVDGTESIYTLTIARAIPRFIHLFIFAFIVLLGLLITYFFIQRDNRQFITGQHKTQLARFRMLAYLLVVLTPISMTMLLLWFFHGATINDVMPIGNDDAYYWHQAASFIEAGFNSGYYTVDEIPADANFSSFYAWGAGVPIFYGSIGQVLGWSFQSIPIINLVLLTLAIAAYIAIVRPNLHQTLLFWLLIISFAYMHIFSIRSMLPLLRQSLALVIAAFFAVFLLKRHQAPIWAKIGLAISIASAVAIRPTFGLLWFPYLLLAFPRIPFVLTGIGSIILLGMGVRLQSWWSSYHPFHTAFVVQDLAEGQFMEAFDRAWSLIVRNIYFLVNFDASPITLAYRAAIFVILVSSITIIVLHMQRNNWNLDMNDVQIRGALFAIYAVLLMYALITVAFRLKASHELRYISPFFLMVMAVLIAIGQHHYTRLSIIPLLFILPITLTQFYHISSSALNPTLSSRYESISAEFESVLQLDADAPNRWCNSVLLENTRYLYDVPLLMSFDPGIGFSWSGRDYILTVDRFRSAYIIVTDEIADDVLPGKNLEPIADVPAGKLYRNWDSDCDIDVGR